MTNEASSSSKGKVIAAWLFVGIPLAWGIIMTLINAAALFG